MKYGILAVALLTAPLSLGCKSGPGAACPDCPPGAEGYAGAGYAGAPGMPAPAEPEGALNNYLPNYGHGGPMAELHGKHFRGPQSHTGPNPGPAMGPASPTVTYPYYTTRGPRDFLSSNPPSIGP